MRISKKSLIDKEVLNECKIYSCRNKVYKQFGTLGSVCRLHYKRFSDAKKGISKNYSLVPKHIYIDERSNK